MPVKLLISSLLFSVAALAQTAESPKIITFNRADTAHCKVVTVGGKPLLETTYEGTTVAINLPQNWANGEFSVFVAVLQEGTGEAEINPKEITAVYPDAAHTRFRWFDKAHDLDTELSRRAAGLGQPGGGPSGESNPIGNSKSADPLPNHPEMMPSTPDAGTRSEEEMRQLQLRNQSRKHSRDATTRSGPSANVSAADCRQAGIENFRLCFPPQAQGFQSGGESRRHAR